MADGEVHTKRKTRCVIFNYSSLFVHTSQPAQQMSRWTRRADGLNEWLDGHAPIHRNKIKFRCMMEKHAPERANLLALRWRRRLCQHYQPKQTEFVNKKPTSTRCFYPFCSVSVQSKSKWSPLSVRTIVLSSPTHEWRSFSRGTIPVSVQHRKYSTNYLRDSS